MQEAVIEKAKRKMVAVLGLEDNVIEDVCREVSTPEAPLSFLQTTIQHGTIR